MYDDRSELFRYAYAVGREYFDAYYTKCLPQSGTVRCGSVCRKPQNCKGDRKTVAIPLPRDHKDLADRTKKWLSDRNYTPVQGGWHDSVHQLVYSLLGATSTGIRARSSRIRANTPSAMEEALVAPFQMTTSKEGFLKAAREFKGSLNYRLAKLNSAPEEKAYLDSPKFDADYRKMINRMAASPHFDRAMAMKTSAKQALKEHFA
jgi:hypothetical protein